MAGSTQLTAAIVGRPARARNARTSGLCMLGYAARWEPQSGMKLKCGQKDRRAGRDVTAPQSEQRETAAERCACCHNQTARIASLHVTRLKLKPENGSTSCFAAGLLFSCLFGAQNALQARIRGHLIRSKLGHVCDAYDAAAREIECLDGQLEQPFSDHFSNHPWHRLASSWRLQRPKDPMSQLCFAPSPWIHDTR